MNIEFRYAEPKDLEKIVETYNSTIASRLVTADLEKVSVESKRDWFNAHSSARRPLWIVLYDKQYAGWMSFNSFYGRPAYNGTVEVSIYLEENFRRKGLGHLCLQKAIDMAPGLDIQNLLGFIFGHNHASLKLFAAFGFKEWACLPAVANLDGILRDLIIVGKKI
ncbi:MAG TPA: N-acetyltransferase family protein [Bacteroidia bacterium]|nr:N-acetyltransferase family protein [Bacteroidia bacterium]